MDDITSGQFAPPPPPPQAQGAPPAPSQPSAPGRPSSDPGKRAAHDEAYARKRAFRELLPPEAREMRVAIYPARQGMEAKGSHRKIAAILAPDWERLGLADSQTLAAYLEERYGPGRYYCEPQDAQGLKDKDAPSWVVSTDQDDDMDDYQDDYQDDPRIRTRARRQSLGRPRRRPGRLSIEDFDEEGDEGPVLDDLMEDDPRSSRSNMADYLLTTAQATSQEKREAMQQNQSMMTTLLMMQQQAREEDRRREEERRREEIREEERRREERKLDEERRRDEQRRYDEERRERERQAQDAANKRMELLVTGATAALTAGAPILAKILEKKDDPLMATLIAKATEREDKSDPTQMLLLKHILEKSGNSENMQAMFSGMAEMNKLSSQMMSDQMRSMLETTNELNSRVLKKALDMASAAGGGDEDKDTFSKIVEAVSAASSMVDSLGIKPQQQPQQQMHPQQQHRVPQGQQPPMQQQQQRPQQPTQEQIQEAIEHHPQRDLLLTIGALRAIQVGAYEVQGDQAATDDGYAQMIAHLVNNMPPELRQAILNDDESTVMEICGPIIMQTPEYRQWVQEPGVAQWLREFLPQLGPVIQQREDMEQSAQGAQEPEQPEQEQPEEDAGEDAGEGAEEEEEDDGEDPV